MSKGLWQITTGESFEVRANSEDEALAIFYVSEFEITEEDIKSVQYIEADTVVEHIQEA